MHHILSSFLCVWKWGQTRSFASDILLPLYTVGCHFFSQSVEQETKTRVRGEKWLLSLGKFPRNCRHNFISRSYHLDEWRLSLVFVYTCTKQDIKCNYILIIFADDSLDSIKSPTTPSKRKSILKRPSFGSCKAQ